MPLRPVVKNHLEATVTFLGGDTSRSPPVFVFDIRRGAELEQHHGCVEIPCNCGHVHYCALCVAVCYACGMLCGVSLWVRAGVFKYDERA